VRLTVYDISGREVVQVFQGSLPAGRHEAAWNGKDKEGHALAAGMYVARLSAASGDRAKKILKIQ
jgi:flagellar hook assembly protein FlgD